MLYIIRGIPGSGKTTLAKKLLKENKIDVFFEADMYFYDEKGNYNYNHKLIKEAHEWCKSKVLNAIKEGKKVAVSNTFIRKWEMEPYIKMAIDNMIPYKIIICKGEYSNIHGVPSEVVERMKRNFEY